MIRHESSWKTAAAEKLLAEHCRRIPTVATYALDVLTGNIPTGRLVFLAVERFLNDLKRSSKDAASAFPYYFDQGAAVAIIKFFRDLAFHTKPPIGYEQFILANLFGWKKASDGFRRFDEIYAEMGKGNRKTPLAAGVGIYGIVGDEEPNAEVYIIGPTKDQAAIAFKDAATMVDGCPELKKLIKKYGCTNKYTSGNLSCGASFMRPVAADRDTLDGPRPHIVIIDEEHEHKDAQVIGKLIAGFKARKQPIAFKITNSGWDRESICWEDHELARKVLEGVIRKESFFAYCCQLDVCPECRQKGKDTPNCENCDNWLDEAVWIKTNPALGVIVTKEYLRKQVADALDKPSGRNLVMRLNFCIWTQSVERFISPEAWRACSWELDPLAAAQA
jgi:phage terminase large subunit-like protein